MNKEVKDIQNKSKFTFKKFVYAFFLIVGELIFVHFLLVLCFHPKGAVNFLTDFFNGPE